MDLRLNNEGDLLIEDDELKLIDGDDAIVQHLTIRLRFFLGEWFLDERLGVPYFDSVLIKNPNLVLVRGILRQAILTTPGVEQLDSFQFTYDNAIRKMRLDCSIKRTGEEGLLDYSKEFIIS